MPRASITITDSTQPINWQTSSSFMPVPIILRTSKFLMFEPRAL